MICEVCEGEGYVRGKDQAHPGALAMLPCLECNGSGIASCCDTAGSTAADAPTFICQDCGCAVFDALGQVRERCVACRWVAGVKDPATREKVRDWLIEIGVIDIIE